jgi:nucleotide-binding universal stress UspA family protein
MIRVKNILYPTDFSSYSNQAYFHALGLAEAYHASLTVVYVCSPKQLVERDYWARQLESIRPSNQAIPVQHVLLVGDPAEKIVRYSADFGIDVIVIGTHGRTGQEHQQMGGVAEKVMREAGCSVMVVKLAKGAITAQFPAVEVVQI